MDGPHGAVKVLVGGLAVALCHRANQSVQQIQLRDAGGGVFARQRVVPGGRTQDHSRVAPNCLCCEIGRGFLLLPSGLIRFQPYTPELARTFVNRFGRKFVEKLQDAFANA